MVTELLGRLKADNITMKNMDNAIWVFVKNRIRILKNIAWNEDFHAVCFIFSITRATVDIDIAIKNRLEVLCVYSRVELCALDLQSGRMKRITEIGIADWFPMPQARNGVIISFIPNMHSEYNI